MLRPLLLSVLVLLLAATTPADERLDALNEAVGRLDLEAGRALHAELTAELGVADPVAITATELLAKILIFQSELEEAAELLDQVYAAAVEAYGEEGQPVAVLVERQGQIADGRSDYVNARRLYERSLSILEQHAQGESAQAATVYYRIGRLDYIQGDNPAALDAYDNALGAYHESVGEDDPRYSVILEQRAAVWGDMGEFDKAIADLDRALELMEKNLPENHPNLGALYHRYGQTEMRRGNQDAAREPLLKALAIREEALGPDHPVTAATMTKLAQLHREQGEPEEAIAYLERIREIRLAAYGPEHPWYAATLYSLSLNHIDVGKYDDALEYALEAERIQRNQLREATRAMPERTGLMYAADRSEGAGLKLALALTTKDSSQEYLKRVWDAQIDARSFILDELAYRRRALGTIDDQKLEQIQDELAAASSELARIRSEAESAEDSELAAAQARYESIERELGEIDDLVAHPPRADRVELGDVAKLLPPGASLVSYSRYESYFSYDFEYLALVRTPEGEIRSIDLGLAEPIDALIADWRDEAGRGALGDDDFAAEARYREVGSRLRAAVWDPVAEHLQSSELALLVPDGQLALVSFTSLPTGKDRYLVESDLALHVLGTERDAMIHDRMDSVGEGLLAIGAPDFDGSPEGIQLADASDLFRGPRSGCQEFRSTRFGPLPGTAEEIDAIVSLWPDDVVTILRGEQAEEASVKALASKPRVLHLATHGFFLRSDCSVEIEDETRGVGGMAPTSQAPRTASPDENLLTLSGLALAGANERNQVAAGEEDGVLTAEEVAALDLSSVEWAVLSACDSGVGDVHVAEGVLGLRRAFQAAGARTLILSLWSVDDRATRDWMTELYRARFVEGQSTAHAVRSAARSQLNARRDRGESTHPFYWAGFVATGDWR